GRSSVAEDRQIAIDDLLVSVHGERILLRSARLGKEVIPRMSNAHAFGNGTLGVYRFLCELQAQDVIGAVGWSWGGLRAAPFLPGVRHRRLILARARWLLRTKQLSPLVEAKGTERFLAAQRLRTELGLPRWVEVTEGDNSLPIDLQNVLALETFV